LYVNGLFVYLYLAQAALDSIDIMETPFVAKQREELAEREEERIRAEWIKQRVEEERKRAASEWKMKREYEKYIAEQQRERKREEEERKRKEDEWSAKEKEEQEKIKTITMLPLPPATERIAGIPLTAYDYQGRKPMETCESGAEDDTTAAFFRASYTLRFIAKCNVNIDKFKEKYIVKMCGANELYQWCHDQIHSKVMNPAEIAKQLEMLFGVPANQSHHKKRRDYEYLRIFFQEMRAAFLKRIKTDEWENYDDEDNLFYYFRNWFCDIRMGAILCYRAKLVMTEFKFSSKPGEPSRRPAEYQSQSIEFMEAQLKSLDLWRKSSKKNQKKKKKKLSSHRTADGGDDDARNKAYSDDDEIKANGDDDEIKPNGDDDESKANGDDDRSKANDNDGTKVKGSGNQCDVDNAIKAGDMNNDDNAYDNNYYDDETDDDDFSPTKAGNGSSIAGSSKLGGASDDMELDDFEHVKAMI